MPPPAVVLKAVNSSSLCVYVGAQSEEAEHQYHLPTYEVVFWENTSNVEVKSLCSVIS